VRALEHDFELGRRAGARALEMWQKLDHEGMTRPGSANEPRGLRASTGF
jgi:hypothetical protein